LANPIISPIEFVEATVQSQSSSTTTDPSYYTQMTTLAASCGVQ
jgi:hypothetical protein